MFMPIRIKRLFDHLRVVSQLIARQAYTLLAGRRIDGHPLKDWFCAHSKFGDDLEGWYRAEGVGAHSIERTRRYDQR
jgi:hypothetical protein